jgi:hypothetical protein
MACMSRAPLLSAPVGLLPLARPLMTGEVLDAAFRLFRAGLLRTLPYAGLVVLALELPTLFATFLRPVTDDLPLASVDFNAAIYFIVLLLSALLLGVVTLRLHAVSRGQRPGFRREVGTALWRWPSAILATLGALGIPMFLFGLRQVFANILPGAALIVLGALMLWPTAVFAVALPAFWCDRLGPMQAIARAARITWRHSWRMAGAILAVVCMLAVFFVLATIVVKLATPLFGRADLFVIATLVSLLTLVVGALGVPFVVAMLIVAYEDLKLRDRLLRGTHA